jgi:hypothetical protein
MYANLHPFPVFEIHITTGAKLCHNYNLSAEQLFWKWGAVRHLIGPRGAHRLDATNLQELKLYVEQERSKPGRSANKGSSARLSGTMSGRSRAAGYGPGRAPWQLNGRLAPGVKREDVDRPVPAAGSNKISFSQVDKIERRECEHLANADFRQPKLIHL